MELPDRYEDLGLIAVGGMGEVRRVQDRRLQSVVAMKISLPEVSASPLLQQRFRDEGRLTAQLHHPGIIAVHDLGELADGRLFFTMEEVRGRTLATIIEEHHTDPDSPWTLRRLVEVFWRACQALAYAHHQGVIHRDIKPDNLMVGGLGEVRVMDWGLARQLSEAEPMIPRLGGPLREQTQVGDVVGTPAFMSPEQARGRLEDLGPETDVYALGATLHAILSGEPPYPGGAVSAWKALIASEPPAPLPAHTPAELRDICATAMHPDALMRPLDASEVAEAVEAWLEGARKQQEAMAILARADEARPEIDGMRSRATTLRSEADTILAPLKPYDPVEKKRPGWRLLDAASDCERQAAVAEAGWLQTVRSALNLCQSSPLPTTGSPTTTSGACSTPRPSDAIRMLLGSRRSSAAMIAVGLRDFWRDSAR
ncbi:MAG: serine/threonine protein kinase [Myxococcota bacterium]